MSPDEIAPLHSSQIISLHDSVDVDPNSHWATGPCSTDLIAFSRSFSHFDERGRSDRAALVLFGVLLKDVMLTINRLADRAPRLQWRTVICFVSVAVLLAKVAFTQTTCGFECLERASCGNKFKRRMFGRLFVTTTQ